MPHHIYNQITEGLPACGEVFGDFYTVVPTYKILRAVLCLYDLPCPGCENIAFAFCHPVSSIFSFQGTMPHKGGENFCLYLSPFLYRAIEAALDGINPLNAGKKKEEALSMLKKWFPQMENFSGQLKKYKVTINDLLAENEKLEARAKASEKGKMKDTMERAKLKSELDNLQRLVDRIPPDILAELKRQKRQHGKER